MTAEELHDFFEMHNDEFLRFDRIKKPRSKRPDLHAFLLLDELFPDPNNHADIVCGAEHDEIYLNVSPEELAAKATSEQLIDLHRCGVRCDLSDGICMFA